MIWAVTPEQLPDHAQCSNVHGRFYEDRLRCPASKQNKSRHARGHRPPRLSAHQGDGVHNWSSLVFRADAASSSNEADYLLVTVVTTASLILVAYVVNPSSQVSKLMIASIMFEAIVDSCQTDYAFGPYTRVLVMVYMTLVLLSTRCISKLFYYNS